MLQGLSRRCFLLAGCAAIVACDSGSGPPFGGQPPPPPPPPPAPGTVSQDFSFQSGLQGWSAGYSDYTLGQEASIDFQSGRRRLPPPFETRFGFFLSSRNVADDVFMNIFKRIAGLVPDRVYMVEAAFTLATNAPAGCIGIGGAPGESVAVKVGGSGEPPATIVINGDYVTTNFDHGQQLNDGEDAVVVGDFAQAEEGDCNPPVYELKDFTTAGAGAIVTSDADGAIWVVIGTDSGYEGLTETFILEGTVALVPA